MATRGRKPGTPKTGGTVPREIDLDRLRECASNGMTLEECALCQGMTKRNLQYRMNKDPSVRETWEEGRTLGIEKVTKALMERVTAGKSDAAIIFYLKARAGWSEKSAIEISGGEKPVQIEVSDIRSKVLGRLLPPEKSGE